jgi:hypothetical protein
MRTAKSINGNCHAYVHDEQKNSERLELGNQVPVDKNTKTRKVRKGTDDPRWTLVQECSSVDLRIAVIA